MPALKKQPLTETYVALEAHSDSIGERLDCAVKAVAIACQVEYSVAREALAAAGRKHGKRTMDTCWKEAMEALGYRATKVSVAWEVAKLQSYPKKGIASITTGHPNRFPKQWADEQPMLFRVRGHIAAFRDGKLHDWSANRSLPCFELYTVEKK